MPKDKDSVLQDLVNASGFVLQLGLEHSIRETRASHGWEVLSREHPWSVGGRTGFADLILGQGLVRIVIECKRPRDGTWVFLVPESSRPVQRFRCQWFSSCPGKRDLLGWADFHFVPASIEAEFCVIRGQGEGERTLLERLASGLLDALPALAADESVSVTGQKWSSELLCVPLIVTTAALELCEYTPSNIDVASGILAQARFERVPFLRFRKSLAHQVGESADVSSLTAVGKEKERTVFVCSADYLPEFLKQLNVLGTIDSAPWVVARSRAERGT